MNNSSGKRARVVHAPRETWVFTQAAPGDGWVATATSSNHLMVIEDGAGTRQNGHVYARLERMGYELTRVAAGPNRSFAYPQRWAHRGHVDSSDRQTLGGFGRQVGQGVAAVAAVGESVPSVVMCGSRGGQAVLSPIIERSWRGPVVCINAGVLTANVPLPVECFFLFITMGHDYFPTKDVGYTTDAFARLAERGAMCVVLHDPDAGHMPDGDMLAELMPIALRIAVDGSVDLSAHVFPPGIQVYSVRNATPVEVVCWQA